MPFTIVKGIFRPTPGRPDGDTVRFLPNNLSLLRELPSRWKPLQVESNCTVRLRYEGIDALESRAREPFSSDATNMNIKLLGLSDKSDEGPGYILTHHLGSHGRPVSFVFADDTQEEDGSSVWLTVDRMRESVNFQLIEAGFAYPLFYDTLFSDLRLAIASAADSARSQGLGLWPHDGTNTGVTWAGADSLSELNPIFPKLWRRLEKYTWGDRESDTLDSFIHFLRSDPDRLLIVSESRFTDLDNIVEVTENTVRMLFPPEDLIFT